MKIMLVMTNYGKKYASTIYQSQPGSRPVRTNKQWARSEIANERKIENYAYSFQFSISP